MALRLRFLLERLNLYYDKVLWTMDYVVTPIIIQLTTALRSLLQQHELICVFSNIIAN